MWVVKVTVWVDFTEDAQAQPTEILSTGSAGHLVAAIHFLDRENTSANADLIYYTITRTGGFTYLYVCATTWTTFTVLIQPVSAKGLLHCFLNHPLSKTLLHELFALGRG